MLLRQSPVCIVLYTPPSLPPLPHVSKPPPLVPSRVIILPVQRQRITVLVERARIVKIHAQRLLRLQRRQGRRVPHIRNGLLIGHIVLLREVRHRLRGHIMHAQVPQVPGRLHDNHAREADLVHGPRDLDAGVCVGGVLGGLEVAECAHEDCYAAEYRGAVEGGQAGECAVLQHGLEELDAFARGVDGDARHFQVADC